MAEQKKTEAVEVKVIEEVAAPKYLGKQDQQLGAGTSRMTFMHRHSAASPSGRKEQTCPS